mmetsp:Transcript_17039/g.39031  ORF Transcript_17039/g.39031 Transcript_17039/m.39031 type:complete len:205 (+) Transcript_17039:115-729(+)
MLPTNAGETVGSRKMPIESSKYVILVGLLSVHALGGGYYAATQPAGAGWRYFSWHPFLMMIGMVGLMGTAALTKKKGGYSNTKLHGIMASAGLLLASGGFYVIYQNKINMGKDHFTTLHGKAGLTAFAGLSLPAVAGAVFLHPDFGIDKSNKLYRKVHKVVSRVLLLLAWGATISGFKTLIGDDYVTLAIFAAPVVIAAPFTLL